MSLLSEIAIEPGKSKTYLRLIFVVYLLTVALIVYSSILLFIKLVLIGFIAILLRLDWIYKRPCPTIKKIQFIGHGWVLETCDGGKQNYAQADILINNMLFQLIQFTNPRQKKLIVLFYDQVKNSQLRLLHLKIGQK